MWWGHASTSLILTQSDEGLQKLTAKIILKKFPEETIYTKKSVADIALEEFGQFFLRTRQ